MKTSMKLTPPRRSPEPFVGWSAHLVLSPSFSAVIIVASATSVLSMTLHSTPEDPQLKILVWWMEVICGACFVLEMTFKQLAWGVTSYFRDPWNCLDFFVVLCLVLALFLDMMTASVACL